MSLLSNPKTRDLIASDTAVLAYLAMIPMFFHTLIHPSFGFQRDEFLYIAMADHLSWGYLEVPPGIALIAFLSKAFFGTSYLAYHIFPALAGALTVFFTGWIARALGGNRFAQVLAGICVVMSPAYLRSSLLLQPVVFEQLYVTVLAFALIMLVKNQNPRWWIIIGIISGIGLLNKYSMLVFGFGLLLGILTTRDRTMFLTRWPWLGGLIALLLFLPNVFWQYHNQWPIFDHFKKLSETQLVHVSPAGFLIGQIWMNPFTCVIWLSGVFFFLFAVRGQAFRAAGWMYLTALSVLLVFSGKDYYLLPAYPMLLAGGSVLISEWTWVTARKWLQRSAVLVIVIIHIPFIPYGIPVFSVHQMQNYCLFMAEHAGLDGPLRWETGRFHKLPQDYADMLGWEKVVREAAREYHRLPAEERSECALISGNYGFAGAIDYYSGKYDIPKAISVNGSYYNWGPHDHTGQVAILVDIDSADAVKYFEEVQLVEWATHLYAREDSVPICIARRSKVSLQEAWPQLSAYRY